MLKININECRIIFKIKTEGPVLIKKPIDKNELTDSEKEYYRGIFNLRPNDRLPDAFFVRTLRQGRLIPYIPGSSLKGIMRSHAERITKTLNFQGCCNIFQQEGVKEDEDIQDDLGCTHRFQILKGNKDQDRVEGSFAYKNSCPICKLFGNGFLQSRILIPDGYDDTYSNRNCIRESNPKNVFLRNRDGIGIDRYSGGNANGAKFDFEVEENATFKFSEIVIRNFDLWQLGLLGYIFQDFKDKLIKIGFGKSRGLGNISGTIENMRVIYYGKYRPAANKICGMVKFMCDSDYYTDEEKNGIVKEIDLSDPLSLNSTDYKHVYSFNSAQACKLLSKLSETFSNEQDNGYINGKVYTVPEKMQISKLEEIKKRFKLESVKEGETVE